MNVALELHRTTPRKATWDELTQTITELYDLLDESETDEERRAAEGEIERVFGTELASKIDATAFFLKKADAEVAVRREVATAATSAARVWQKRQDHVRGMIRRALTNLGVSKVKGNVYQAYLTAGRDRVGITDEEAVPAKYKSITLNFPLDAWQTICQIDPMLTALQEWPGTVTVDGAAVKDALKRGEHVPGACLETGDPVLTVRG